MRQSRKGSLTESIVNTMIGFWIGVGAQWAVFPLFGMSPSFAQNCGIAVCFTIVSIVRSYVLRRLFNRFNWFNG